MTQTNLTSINLHCWMQSIPKLLELRDERQLWEHQDQEIEQSVMAVTADDLVMVVVTEFPSLRWLEVESVEVHRQELQDSVMAAMVIQGQIKANLDIAAAVVSLVIKMVISIEQIVQSEEEFKSEIFIWSNAASAMQNIRR